MAEKKTPMRKCIGCNEMKDKKQLLRIVRGSDGVISFDSTGKMSGRGAYICGSVKCFDAAVKAKRFERAFKAQIPADVTDALRAALDGVSE